MMTVKELWQLVFSCAGVTLGVSFAVIVLCMTIGLVNGWMK